MKLTLYINNPAAVDLRPLEMKRGWMDATAESFAYRCLPLNISNAHGWGLYVKKEFSLVWDGGNLRESIKITPDSEEIKRIAVSHFGHGVLTFHVYGVFVTEPGWNLYVSGPPNGVKDGIAPLSGIIETDWSPYSFTMNWRCTRPNVPIVFEEGEVFCALFPVQRGVAEAFEPEIRPFSEAPELMRQNEMFKKARSDFAEQKRGMTYAEGKSKWQKRYFQGLMPDDTQGCPEHQTKLKIKPFTVKGFDKKA